MRRTREDMIREALRLCQAGEGCISRQIAMIAKLRADRHSTTEASRLLSEFHTVQTLYKQAIARFRNQMDEER